MQKKEVLHGFPFQGTTNTTSLTVCTQYVCTWHIDAPQKPCHHTADCWQTKPPEVHSDPGIHCSVHDGHIYTSSVCHGTILLHVSFEQSFQPPNSKHTPLRSTSVGNCHRSTCNEKRFYRHAFHNHEV